MSYRRDQIYIIGAGAIGRALAAALKAQNKNVVLIRARVFNIPDTIEPIELELHDKKSIRVEVPVTSLTKWKVLDGIVVLTNKSYGNRHLAENLKGKIKNSPVVIMQNGLGVEDPFLSPNFRNIYRCILFVTSQFISPEKVRFKPVATSPIGVIKGSVSYLPHIVHYLNSNLFRFNEEKDIVTVVWKKTVINCVFNSICPLLDVDNGIFHRDEEALILANTVINECVAIASEFEITLDGQEILNSLLLISNASDGQIISTLQDIKKGCPTEIRNLNLAIRDRARSINKESLVQITNVLGELTYIKSRLNNIYLP